MEHYFLTTERLKFRRMCLDDAPFILELVTQASFITNIGDKGVTDLFSAQEHIHTSYLSQYEKLGFGLYLLVETSTEQPIGVCGLVKRDSFDFPDIGYALLERVAGKGYATEAAIAVLDYAKRELGIDKVLAITSPDNIASQRVLEKLGLTFQKQIYLPGYRGASCYYE